MKNHTRWIGWVGVAVVLALVILLFFAGEHHVVRIAGAILGWVLLRDLVFATGLVPPGSPLEFLFINHSHESLASSILRRLGVDHRLVVRRPVHTVSLAGVDQLVALLTRYTRSFARDISYGKETVINSRYYVNTMEASHSENDLHLMADLIVRLILRSRNDVLPDFILTPKAGNPLLAQALHDTCSVPVVLRKAEHDKSRARGAEKAEALFVNFEGIHQLAELTRHEERTLRGVAVDCNTSGGSELLDSMREFNTLIGRNGWSVEAVSEAYVLFRPDNHTNIDERFSQHGLRIVRYFDLNEAFKKEIIEKGPIDDAYEHENQRWLLDFRRRLHAERCLLVNS